MKSLAVGVRVLSMALALVLLAISGCQFNNDTEEDNNLETVEIREYEGVDLSSTDDFFWENSIKGPQTIDIESYSLSITGLIQEPKSYTYDEVIDGFKNYKKVSELNCVDQWSVTILWEGMLVRELIEESNPLPEAKTVIFHAYDGYTTSFPIEYIMDNDILLAHKMNGLTLPAERGFPFQLAAESKWGYKWIKWVTKIELSDDVDYEGYWESRGYSDTGDLDESFYD